MNDPISKSSFQMRPDAADTPLHTPISVIVPTYREAENIPLLLDRLAAVRAEHDLVLDVLFMDDNSHDGAVEAVAAAGHDWAQIVVRTTDKGLSQSVVDGFERATGAVLVCMDCDLSHPPEVIPQMVLGLAAGQQFVIGSRYVPGGSTDDDWGLFRFLNSIAATALARPLTRARDPMSGFFALRKADFHKAHELNPIGYKIGLELIVKCGFENVGEVPIHFSDRQHGESKLSFKEQLRYIQHIRRLYLYRFSNAMYLAQFLVVGAAGTVVNLAVLSLLQGVGLRDATSLAGGIAVSTVTNFLLNRRFTFSYAKHGHIGRQFAGFLGATAVGLVVNYAVALSLRSSVLADADYGLHLAALAGIAAGMVFNFLGNRYLVFRKRYLRK